MRIKELAPRIRASRSCTASWTACGSKGERAYLGVQGGGGEGDRDTHGIDAYDWIIFLPKSDCLGAYNRYFGRLNTGKMKIRDMMARKG